jgi:hypothetical protein
MIRHAVRHHFGDIEISEDLVTSYFDKLIQIPLRVPRLGHAEVKGYLILLFAELEVKRGNLTEANYLKSKEAIRKNYIMIIILISTKTETEQSRKVYSEQHRIESHPPPPMMEETTTVWNEIIIQCRRGRGIGKMERDDECCHGQLGLFKPFHELPLSLIL